MQYTSLGYHTFTSFKPLTFEEAKLLKKDLEWYRNETNEIDIFPVNKVKVNPDGDRFVKALYSNMPKYYVVKYKDKYKGIRWLLRLSNRSPKFIDESDDEDKSCSIKATINPKVFIGIKDYISAANSSCLKDVETLFNIEAEKISPILGRFDSFGLNRSDYCINFDLNELNIPCTPEQMMILLKRSYIPDHYVDWMEYDKKHSHRRKSDKYSFYLKSDSANISCYLKHHQLKKDFPDCPNIENALHVIRFELQYKYPKIYNMSKIIGNKSGFSNLINYMLSDDVCSDVINKYYNKVLRKGDYFTLKEARKQIQFHHFKLNKEKRLIDTLERINECRGISKAKATYQGEALEEFRRTLRELADIGINPVTIPKEWNIKGNRIPNLLDAYYRKIEDEHAKKLADERRIEIIEDYFAERAK